MGSERETSASEGREPDLAALFRAHASGLAGAVRAALGPGADVQEVLQEAFLRAWRARERGALLHDPTAFVFVITMNLAKDLRRARARRPESLALEDVTAMQLESREPTPSAALESREALATARAAIGALRDPEREVFGLRVSAGLSFEAIADALEIPVGTAKSRMRAALAHLRRALDPSTANTSDLR